MSFNVGEINPVKWTVESDDFEEASPDARVIAVALARVADALYWLGTGDAVFMNGAKMGAIEMLSKEVKDGFEQLNLNLANRD